MRLINTTTLQFQEFFDSQLPKYAILSHTWGNDEVSYCDYVILTSHWDAATIMSQIVKSYLRPIDREKEGFRKAQECCKLALSRGLDWVWIDSCCIDKSSSAELSEAINSMWAWYSKAEECYVYLADVPAENRECIHVYQNGLKLRLSSDVLEKFRLARWFSRGWTLQELLAPKSVFFCNNGWEIIATKEQIGWDVSDITGIPLMYLNGSQELSEASIAQKMSWIAKRQTTRVEDMAYCMLGLFHVNMPLIYGEGRKAFMRLQLEILKKSRDQSLFAWADPQLERSGLLAPWPTAFKNSGDIVKVIPKHFRAGRFPYAMTNVGLEIRRPASDPDTSVQGILGEEQRMVAPSSRWDWQLECGRVTNIQKPRTDDVKREVYWQNPVLIKLQRFGSTMQRIDCDKLQLSRRALDTRIYGSNAYTIYYVEQQGL